MKSQRLSTTFKAPALVAGLALLLSCNGLHAGDCQPQWLPTFGAESGVNARIRALAVFDDGSGGGPALYAGGEFITAGGVAANRIARWDGSTWSALGSGMNTWVGSLAVFDDGSGGGPALYAGGLFTTAGGVVAPRIARWNGSTWSALGSGVNSVVNALAVFDDGSGGGPALYAGGQFTAAGGVPANWIAKWNGSAWSALGSGVDNWVHALAVFDDGMGGGPALYAGGLFTTAGGVTVNRIAMWNGSTWSSLLGGGLPGGGTIGVRALAGFDDGSGGGPALYAGGDLLFAGGFPVQGIARWYGFWWSGVGGGMNAAVRTIAVFDDGSGGGPALYAGGDFTAASHGAANRIARWDGSTTWSALGSGMDNFVDALAVFDDGSGDGPALYAGGEFTLSPAGDSYLARWQGCPATPAIPGDLDGDGIVNGADLGLLLLAWGICPRGESCPADLDGDGQINGADLGILLLNWTLE